ncbi:MAG: DNA repair protein RadA [Firmicutes bacterium]|nr:DNA repair protein RadA [Bacillota bacterium]
MGPKREAVFVCQECGHESLKWLGRCPSCQAWNSLVEEVRPGKSGAFGSLAATRTDLGAQPRAGEPPIPIGKAVSREEQRFSTSIGELDRVLGGGMVRGSVVLVGGDPGIGKSTLLLQASQGVSSSRGRVLYVSGEESVDQVKLRADRIGAASDRLFIAAQTDLGVVLEYLRSIAPMLVVIDSIQTMYHPEFPSAPGSVGQVRESTAELIRFAKTSGVSVVVVGHVTKAGTLAGPRVLEHMVDTVLYFEGEQHHSYRVLRAVKNRFGSTNEIGVFEMRDGGLKEVANPSELFLSQRPVGAAGSVVVASMEGSRPLLVEVQALVGATNFMGTPRRLATGVDYNRVSIILAVLEKRAGLALGAQDVYVNVAGGVRLEEPAADLGIAIAAASSFRNVPCDPQTVVLGELGLAGEVRGVARVEPRLQEAAKLGFRRCLIPRNNLKGLGKPAGTEIIGVENIGAALEVALLR